MLTSYSPVYKDFNEKRVASANEPGEAGTDGVPSVDSGVPSKETFGGRTRRANGPFT